jgi:HAD superfamily hydrolase (TIGR01509 family)
MPPAAYLLDLYDTLAYGDWWTWTVELAELTGATPEAIARGFHATRLERNTGAYPSAEQSLRHVLEAAGEPEPSPSLLRRAVAAEAAFDERVALYDDALPTIAALRERGARLALVSNCSHTTRQIVDRLGFEELFDTVVLSFELGVRKPDAGIYRAALDGVGARPGEALFVDDQTAYCDGARALGIDTRLIVRPTAHPAEGFAAPNGHRVIASLGDLL